jgi:hypothetical protein
VAFAVVVWFHMPSLWFTAAMLALLGVMVAVAPLAVAQSTRAWDTGATGEAATAAILEALVALGAVVLHDRRIPRSRANIDHVLICPAGVFAIETKSYEGEVGQRDGELTHNGRRVRAVAEVRREAEVVGAVIAPVPVVPIIVIHRAAVGVREVGGVRVLRAARLAEYLGGLNPVLAPAEVADLATRIDRALPRASRP